MLHQDTDYLSLVKKDGLNLQQVPADKQPKKWCLAAAMDKITNKKLSFPTKK